MDDLKVVVRKARQEKGWTMGELAERVGISRASVCKIESGEVKTVKSELAAKLARELDLPLSAFSGTALGGVKLPADRRGEFTVKILDDWLDPVLRAGDIAVAREESDADSGKCVAVRRNGEDCKMRIIKMTVQGVELCGLHGESEFHSWPDFTRNYSVQGVLTEIRRPIIDGAIDGELFKKENA